MSSRQRRSDGVIWYVVTWGDLAASDVVDEDTPEAVCMFDKDLRKFCETMMEFFK